MSRLLALVFLVSAAVLFFVVFCSSRFILKANQLSSVITGGASDPVWTTESHKRHSVNQTVTGDRLYRLADAVISDMIKVTQSDDLNLRGKWQRAQVTKYCRKYGLQNELYALPKDYKEKHNLYRHLIYDVQRAFIFCFLPKAGCTTLRRLIFAMQRAIPRESVEWEKVSEQDYLRPAIMKTSFLKESLTDQRRRYKLMHYFKFMMVRNPLVRLVSAYRDKIEPPLEFCEHDKQTDPLVTDFDDVRNIAFFQAHRRLIQSKYHPHSILHWARANGSYNLSVDFPTFVRWIVETKDRELNEHFSSILFNAAPCRVDYHLFLNFKNYSGDVRLLIHRLNSSSEFFVDRSSHSSLGTETHSTLPHYYSQLSTDLKRRLFVRMTQELDFYYHLYPEEQLSHLDLLGVNTLVARPQEYWS